MPTRCRPPPTPRTSSTRGASSRPRRDWKGRATSWWRASSARTSRPPPPVPSILTSPAAPSTDQLNQFANDLISRPGVVVTPMTQVTGGLPPFGTTEHPQITYFNDPSGVTVKGAGNVEGVGILIVEGDLTIQGSLSFSGLIIVRGRTRVIGTTTDTGNATLYGALWTNDLNLTIGGSAVMNYSSAALAFANQASGGMTLPTPVQLTSLIDCSQAVAGTSGCP